MVLCDNIKSHAVTHDSILKILPPRTPFVEFSINNIQTFRKVFIAKTKIIIARIC